VLTESIGSFSAGLLLDKGLNPHETCAVVATVSTVLGFLWCLYYVLFRICYKRKMKREAEEQNNKEDDEMELLGVEGDEEEDEKEETSAFKEEETNGEAHLANDRNGS